MVHLQYIDSISLQQVRLASGNFDLIITLMNDSSKVLDVEKSGFNYLEIQMKNQR
ncbi:MAG: hypothetical protein IPF62_08800 [Bacteroidetes bacterium]|nr:hypothetical protein [Bacteroidota bacterium]